MWSAVISPRFFPRGYGKDRAKLWHTTVAAIFPAVFAPYYALPGLRVMLREPVSTVLLTPANSYVWRALGVSLAHFTFDFTVMAWWAPDFRSAMRRPLYNQMMFHHFASLLLWPYAMHRQKCVLPVAYFMVTEASNAFLNGRWLCAELQYPNFRMAFDALFFLSYTLIRVIPCFVMLVFAFLNDWPHYFRQSNLLDLIATAFIFIPFGLNVFWYSIILKTARKTFGGRSGHPDVVIQVKQPSSKNGGVHLLHKEEKETTRSSSSSSLEHNGNAHHSSKKTS